MYTANDIEQHGPHTITKDRKYYLSSDGHYDYWKRIKSWTSSTIVLGYTMGHYSYDYCFRSNLDGCVERLNKLLEA